MLVCETCETRTQTLKKLYLNETDMGPLGVGVLSDGLRENRSLEVLTLNKTPGNVCQWCCYCGFCWGFELSIVQHCEASS